jgi:hypothetical protein
MPLKGTPESIEFKRLWNMTDHKGKLDLCNLLDVSYDRAQHAVAIYKSIPKPDEEFEFDKVIPWYEQIEIFKSMDRLVSLHEQTPSEVTIKIETDTPQIITYLADWQLGQNGVDYDSFRRDIQDIKNSTNLHCEVGGDGYQNIIQPSKIGSSHNQIPIAPQRGLFVLTLKELQDKVKILRTGNHNYWSTTAIGEDWEHELAHRLKLLYMKHVGIVNWQIGDMVYKEVAMHSSRFNSSFNQTHANKQHQRIDFPDARIIVVEHKHLADMEQYRYNNQECIAIRTGTYAIRDDYAAQWGFFGAHVSNPAVVLYPHEDRLVGFKDFHDAIVYLKGI